MVGASSKFGMIRWCHKYLHVLVCFSGFLTSHPARKFVIEFLRTIVIDSMSQPVVAKSASVIDILLEVWYAPLLILTCKTSMYAWHSGCLLLDTCILIEIR